MKTYTFTFIGRLKGALGTHQAYTATRKGNNQEEALIALYNEFEHILIKSVTETNTCQ